MLHGTVYGTGPAFAGPFFIVRQDHVGIKYLMPGISLETYQLQF